MPMASSRKLSLVGNILDKSTINKRVYCMKKQLGLTLTEMIIAVAIIGIIAAVAWPAFERQSAKGRRTDAAMALTSARQALIAFRSDNGSYPADANSAMTELQNYRPTAPNTPAIDCKNGRGYQITAGGVDSCQGYYNITVTAANANSFTLTATPTITRGDECTTLTLDHLGTRGSTGGPADRCWAQ
jgi:type IV pilus assembly protein PilE